MSNVLFHSLTNEGTGKDVKTNQYKGESKEPPNI